MKEKRSFFIEILNTITKYFLVFIGFIILYLLCSGIRIVDSGSVALVLRFGKLVGNNYEEQVHKPGLLLAFPSFIDEVIIVPSDKVFEQPVSTHYTVSTGDTGVDGGYLITGDQNIAVVSASVKYIISNPVDYALHVKDIDKIIDSTVSTAMLNEAANIAVDDLLTSKKDVYGESVKDFAMDKIVKFGLGIEITSLELTQVAMPKEVKPIYDEVNGATVTADTMIKEANIVYQNLISGAKAEYDNLISRAKSEYANEVAEATKEMAEFWGYLDEYNKAPDLLTQRVYALKVVEAIKKIETVRVVQDGESNIIINP